MINPQNPHFDLTPVHPQRKRLDISLVEPGQKPVVSIITGFYNTGEVFMQTAQSVLYQSLQQWEWLIINDGSTDAEALRILDEYRHKDPRIRVIDHPKNYGLSAARNTGVEQAVCEFIVFVDSDDLLEPTAIEKWWWFLQTQKQFSFVASYHVAFGGKNFLWTGGFHEGAMNAERNRVSMMCMVRKSVYQAAGGFDESIRGGLEDWEFWMRCAAQGYWGATIPEFLAWYRVRKDHTDRWENLQETRMNEFRALFQDKYPGLYQGGFPCPVEHVDLDLASVNLEVPAANQLEKKSPHLLIILPWLVMGGAERFILNLSDQLSRQGWSISIVTTAKSENLWLHEFEERTSDVFILPNILPIKEYPRFISYLIQSRGFDALLIQGSIEAYRLLPAIRQLFPHLPILDYLHFVTPDWMDGGFPRLSYVYRDGIDLTITSCQQVKQWMVAEGAEEERLRVCPIGVDPEHWKPDAAARLRVRQKMGIRDDEVVLVYAARLEAQKQPLICAETLRMLMEQGVAFRGLIAGDGTLRAELEQKIKIDGLEDKVTLLGSVSSEEMAALLAAGDIFFLPSENEGISSAIYEAMACGIPVVGADVGGQAELVTPECGILVPPQPPEQQPEEYSKVLQQLIEDSERRKRMGAASRERILCKFTLDHMGNCMSHILGEAIQRKREGTISPPVLSPEERFLRETQHVVEYLQARQEWRSTEDAARKYQGALIDVDRNYQEVFREYSELIQPKPASYWFYLWLRQLFLPVFTFLKEGLFGDKITVAQKWLKRTLLKL